MADKNATGKRSARTGGKKPAVTQAAAIVDHLCAADKKLARMIEQVGPYTLTVNEIQSSFEALAESIVYQQITGKAAQSICQKVMTNFGTTSFPGPKLLLAADIEELRTCGLSRAKAMALQDLSEKYLSGLVPPVEAMLDMSDEEIIERLTAVRGIGEWTVQMMLIFRLGRLDVLPSTDYGVRKGFARTFYSKPKFASELPKPSEIAERAERWRPFRSAASWYMWRALEVDSGKVNLKVKAKAVVALFLLAVSLAVATSGFAAHPVEARNAYDYDPLDEEDDPPATRRTGSSPRPSDRTAPDRRGQASGNRRDRDIDSDDDDDRGGNDRYSRSGRSSGADTDRSARSSADRKAPPKLSVPAFITYWTHDALGYHPSMAFTIENSSDSNLLGEVIQLQAHFRLVSEGILTVYRWQTRLDTIGGKQQVNTEAHGKRPFELPLDPNDWPMIECKIIAKIGNATSEDTQNLVVARIQSLAMSDEDARMQLNTQLGRNHLARAKQEQGKKKFESEHPPARTQTKPTGSGYKSGSGANNSNANSGSNSNSSSYSRPQTPAPPKTPEKPLTAVANTLGGSFYVGNSKNSAGGTPVSASSASSSSSAEQFLVKSNLPGLGDDFYQFEKALGMPVETDAREVNWMWANYKKHPQAKIVAGSKGRTGKADVVVCAMQQERGLSDSQFITCARALYGKFKAEKPAAVEHSVRYTPAGRIELATVTTQSCRAVTFTSTDSDGQKIAVVAVSRLPGNVIELLKEEGKRTRLLQLVLAGLGEENASAAPQRSGADDDN